MPRGSEGTIRQREPAQAGELPSLKARIAASPPEPQRRRLVTPDTIRAFGPGARIRVQPRRQSRQ